MAAAGRLAVVTVLQQKPGTWLVLSDRVRRRLWALAGVDVMAAAWMIAAGDWLDHASRVTSVIALGGHHLGGHHLGGHHLVVLWLAVLGFVILAVLAILTGGGLACDLATDGHIQSNGCSSTSVRRPSAERVVIYLARSRRIIPTLFSVLESGLPSEVSALGQRSLK